jgi:hypothetical protein
MDESKLSGQEAWGLKRSRVTFWRASDGQAEEEKWAIKLKEENRWARQVQR